MRNKVMTVDELLKNSLVNFALDYGNTKMLQSLSKDEYEIVNDKSNELDNDNLNYQAINFLEEITECDLYLRKLKDFVDKNIVIGIDYAEDNDLNK